MREQKPPFVGLFNLMFTVSYNEQLYHTHQDKIRRSEMRSDLFQKELGGVVNELGVFSVMDDCLPIILLSASTGAGQCPGTELAFLTSSFSHLPPAAAPAATFYRRMMSPSERADYFRP